MAHFAQVINGIVEQVIVADLDFINSGAAGDPSQWIQTSYNANIRNKFAGIGDMYLSNPDIFIPQKPYPSWILSQYEVTGLDENYNISVQSTHYKWTSPVPYPSTPPAEGYAWIWSELNINWIQVPIPEYIPITPTPQVTSSPTPTPV